MKTYTIIGGVNGTGKTSLSGVLKGESNDLGQIIDVDKIVVANNCDSLQADKIAVQKIEQYLDKGITFTQETTLSGSKTLNTVKKAKELGYYIRLFYIGLDTFDESLSRIKNRVVKGGHNIASEDVKRRFGSRFKTLLKVLPYCNEVRFYDNDNGFVKIADYINGEIISTNAAKPLWMKDFEVELRQPEDKK